MKRLCWGLLVFTTPANPLVSIAPGEDPRRIAEPGRGAEPNSVPDLAGAGTSAAGAVLLSPAAAVIAARRWRTPRT
jgi:hypothetical protein